MIPRGLSRATMILEVSRDLYASDRHNPAASESRPQRSYHRTKLTPEMRALYEKAGVSPPEKLLRIG